MFPQFDATTRYDIVELDIPNSYTKSEINFADQEQLRSDGQWDIIIQGIETFTQFSQSLSGNDLPLPNVAQLLQTSLILYIDGEESQYGIPLSQLHRVQCVDGSGNLVPNVRTLYRVDNVEVSWQKCQLFTNAASGWNTGGSGAFAFQFGIHYKRYPAGTYAAIKRAQQKSLQALINSANC